MENNRNNLNVNVYPSLASHQNTVLCSLMITPKTEKVFVEAVKNHYWYQMYIGPTHPPSSSSPSFPWLGLSLLFWRLCLCCVFVVSLLVSAVVNIFLNVFFSVAMHR